MNSENESRLLSQLNALCFHTVPLLCDTKVCLFGWFEVFISITEQYSFYGVHQSNWGHLLLS